MKTIGELSEIRKRLRGPLNEMLEAAKTCNLLTLNIGFYHLQVDKKKQSAIIENMMIMRKTALQVPIDLRNKNARIPWLWLSALKDASEHQYKDADLYQIWVIITGFLPSIVPNLQQMLEDLDSVRF